MRRSLWGLLPALLLFQASAQEPDPSPELRELRQLRLLIEAQGKQIETLSRQVLRLEQSLDKSLSLAAAPVPTVPTVAPVPPVPPVPPVAPSAPTSGLGEGKGETSKLENEEKTLEAPTKHVVEKGETLTSIAKHYNIPLSELQKLNKIENDRKLQIGQNLVLPSPKLPPTPSEEKKTP